MNNSGDDDKFAKSYRKWCVDTLTKREDASFSERRERHARRILSQGLKEHGLYYAIDQASERLTIRDWKTRRPAPGNEIFILDFEGAEARELLRKMVEEAYDRTPFNPDLPALFGLH